jgi:RNA polymerase sigma factor (sigma-70 family)
MDPDRQLLAEFAEHKSEEAFALLVERHTAMVYHVARRTVNDPHLAEDVTQAVFLLLARKAAGLRQAVVVAGWLFNVARLTATDANKMQRRRLRREREAAMSTMAKADSATDPIDWDRVSPMLNDAIARLSRADRDAVVLRFLQDKSHSQVGAALGISEDAAKMRLMRALRKLRASLESAGMQTTELGLAMLLSAKPLSEAPAGLAERMATGALRGTGQTANALARAISRKMIPIKTILGIPLLVLLIAAGTVVVGGQRQLALPTMAASQSSPSTRPALLTPKAAVLAYLRAVQSDDVSAAKAAAYYGPAEERLLDLSFNADRQHALYIQAVRQRFGADAASRLSFDVNAVLIEIINKSVVHEHGDTADIGNNGDYPCRRIGNEWRYDLIQMHRNDPVAIERYTQYELADADFEKQVVQRILNGRWSSPNDLTQSIEAEAPKPPTPTMSP